MAKNRKRDRSISIKNHVQSVPNLINRMRGLIQATRSRSDLRSITPTEARDRMNDLFRKVIHEQYKKPERPVSQGQVPRTQVSGRRAPSQFRVRREGLPVSLYDLFHGAERALVCSSRETRREVMFAMRRTGKAGARRNRKARWRSSSYISCKKG